MNYTNSSNANISQSSQYAGQCPQVAPCSELDVTRNRIEEILNFANMQGDRIENIEAKLNGGGGIGSDKTLANPRPVPNGTIGQMGEILDDIMARLQRTDAAVSRLRSAI